MVISFRVISKSTEHLNHSKTVLLLIVEIDLLYATICVSFFLIYSTVSYLKSSNSTSFNLLTKFKSVKHFFIDPWSVPSPKTKHIHSKRGFIDTKLLTKIYFNSANSLREINEMRCLDILVSFFSFYFVLAISSVISWMLSLYLKIPCSTE